VLIKIVFSTEAASKLPVLCAEIRFLKILNPCLYRAKNSSKNIIKVKESHVMNATNKFSLNFTIVFFVPTLTFATPVIKDGNIKNMIGF